MKYKSEVIVPITISKNVSAIEFKDTILVSVDCFRCKRSGRTVVMYMDQEKTFCTPTNHRFPGRIVSIDVSDRKNVGLSSTRSVVTAKYEIEYDFESFVDKKYPHREIKPEPTWSRVTFLIMSRCGKQTEAETQNNIERPWTAV